MEAPHEEAGTWNGEFEFGKCWSSPSTRERRLLRPVREALQRNGAMYYIVDRRLEPRAVHQATLHRSAGAGWTSRFWKDPGKPRWEFRAWRSYLFGPALLAN
jgi:hypothetical protein